MKAESDDMHDTDEMDMSDDEPDSQRYGKRPRTNITVNIIKIMN